MLKLKQTCGACPEQYDAYDEQGNRVGYLRLRHGYFRAEYYGNTVYEAQPKGDGIFHSEERNFYLNRACEAIEAAMAGNGYPREEEPEFELFDEDPLY